MTLQNPLLVVEFFEFDQDQSQFLNGSKCFHPEQVLLEQENEAFGATVALRLSNKGRRGLDAEKLQFPLEIMGHISGTVIMAHFQPHRNLCCIVAKVFPDSLANRFQCLESIPLAEA